MDRDNAEDFYYFNKDYFDAMVSLLGDELLYTEVLYEDQVIAANLCFVSEGNIHIHLSGTRTEYLHLSPAYLLRYAITVWGKEHGCRMIHHGGGVSNEEQDSLYLFKKQFGKNTDFLFYTGKKVWNQPVYDALCKLTNAQPNCEFFPAYRQRSEA
jgi:lipid II:glycine glycyltransferase (peptidoglycan interpeptide bridge formation enzyme)